jgi:hypothetical protein
MNYEEKKQNQINDAKKLVNKWELKLNFSAHSLFFFISMLVICTVNLSLGTIPIIIFSVTSIFFTQQTIRSYNYLKYHKVSLKSLEMIHNLLDKKKVVK